ncbi:aspartate/glutamate racemase family protein [Natrinema ejinorense]|uniref:Aspartate racemase n=1 Tax=Natrinema ejinorense TaxID=373386 RepID=A0A2A5QUS2_9EURY|nr:aspartate/glutamate racemase family protein [Natrinema ejinorense]PCR90608.1 aspartate racemase [Natrinema ejinorense]
MTDPRTATPRTIGVLGGMSSQSTVEYYRLLDAGINDSLGGHSSANVLVRSVNFERIVRYIRTEQWEAAGEYLADAVMDLEAGGAAFVVMATNTMHRVAPQLAEQLSIPFLHIVDVTADAIRDDGLDTVGVLGTQATMEGEFYRDRFADHGIDVVVPDRGSREEIDRIVFDELTRGRIRDPSRSTYLDVIDDLVANGANGVVLGCTEITDLVSQSDCPETPLFDTTELHTARAVERSLGGVESERK